MPMDDDVLICRCQEVAFGQVREAVRQGARTVREVKLLTEAGMGLCQGRTCGRLVARELASATGVDESTLLPRQARPPVRLVPVEALQEDDPA